MPNPEDAPKKWELRLYVAGQTQKSVKAFSNLKKFCEEHLPGEYHIEVIDLLVQPQTSGADPENHWGLVKYGTGYGRT